MRSAEKLSNPDSSLRSDLRDVGHE